MGRARFTCSSCNERPGRKHVPSGLPLNGLGENQFTSCGADRILMLGGEGRFTHDHINFIKAAELGEGLLAELSGVDEQHDLLRLFHHPPLGLDEQQIPVVER